MLHMIELIMDTLSNYNKSSLGKIFNSKYSRYYHNYLKDVLRQTRDLQRITSCYVWFHILIYMLVILFMKVYRDNIKIIHELAHDHHVMYFDR